MWILSRDLQVKRIGAQVQIFSPADVAMRPHVDLLERAWLIPNGKNASPRKVRQIDLPSDAVCKSEG